MLIAAVLAAAGFGRLGAGLLVQHCRGLRPGELLALRGRDIMLPEDRTLSNGAVAVLNLGMKAGTKARRAQCTTIVASNAPVAMCALRALAASTPKEQLILFGYNLGAYQRLLGRCCEVLGLPGFTPHSPRAGFATDAWLAGVDFVSIREAGRWLADSSLRVYLDGVSTASLESSPTAAAWAPLAAWIEAHFGAVFPWWPATSWVPTAPLPPVLLEAAARLQSRKRRPESAHPPAKAVEGVGRTSPVMTVGKALQASSSGPKRISSSGGADTAQAMCHPKKHYNKSFGAFFR